MKQLLFVWVFIFGITISRLSAEPGGKTGTNDFTGIAKQVIKLLETGDADAFANTVSGTKEEWDKVPAQGRLSAEQQSKKVQSSASRVVAVAKKLGVDSSKLRFTVKQVNAESEGSIKFSAGTELPYIRSAEITLTGEPRGELPAGAKWRGEYKLAIRGLIQLPDGWRAYEGIAWKDFPQELENNELRRELRILSLAESRKPLTAADDPAFAEFGEAFLRLLKTGDRAAFLSQTTPTIEEQWTRFLQLMEEHNVPTNKWPPRAALEKGWKSRDTTAKTMLSQAEEFGISFKGAQMKLTSAEAKYIDERQPGTIEELSASTILFTFDVQSDLKAKNGTPISGQYIVRLGRATWRDSRWEIDDSFGWKSFPQGLVDEKTLKELEFESYVAEYGRLPPGTLAPEIEFTLLEGDKKSKLSDYRGQVVLIDFWATWCGPCQAPMAELQEIAAKHPEWKGKAALLSLSIDEKLPTLQKHLEKRGWTNSVNAWAGDGEWMAPAAKAFRLRGVPSSYLVGRDGTIVWSGHPSGAQLEKRISDALKN